MMKAKDGNVSIIGLVGIHPDDIIIIIVIFVFIAYQSLLGGSFFVVIIVIIGCGMSGGRVHRTVSCVGKAEE